MPQLEESLKRDIDQIRDKVLEMGGLVERALNTSLQAFTERNGQLAYSIILRDRYIDELEKEIDRLCQEFLIRQLPAAGHLRFVYAVIKINNELERVGDYAESIARRSLELNSTPELHSYEKFVEIANLAIPMLRNALQAFMDKNADLAKATREMEEKVDNIRYSIHNDIIELGDKDKLPSEALPPLMTIANRFERVADQACNICEEVLFICTGKDIKHEGKEVFRVLFVDERDSCRAQMAEGIGRSLNLERFRFNSAGISPRPVDEQTVRFMSEKGIDISGQTSKYLNQTLEVENYQVIVSLCQEAEAAFPPPPTKTVSISWHVDNPSKTEGSKEEIQAAYDKTYKYLDKQIRDLVQAILVDDDEIKKVEVS